MVNNLGLVYVGLQRPRDAHIMLYRALHGYERVWGPKHTSTLGTINNLGLLYESIGEHESARQMFQQALEGYQESLGYDHESVSDAAHNLSLVEMSLGRFDEAEDHLRRALHVKKMVLRPNSTSTLNTANDLALLLLDTGRARDAVILLQTALDGKEKVLGPNHISTLGTANNLGLVYTSLGMLDKAEALHLRAINRCIDTLGADNMLKCTEALAIVWGFASFCAASGQTDDARKYYQQVLEGYESILGKDRRRLQALLFDIAALEADSVSPMPQRPPIWRRQFLQKVLRRKNLVIRRMKKGKGYIRLG